MTLTTPRKIWQILSLGVAGLALMHLAMVQMLFDLHDRELQSANPSTADALIIPVFGQVFSFLFLSVLSVGVGIPLLWRAYLPASLSTWNPERPVWSWTATIMFGLPVVAILLMTIVFSIEAISVLWCLGAVFGVYALLSARAALISKSEY